MDVGNPPFMARLATDVLLAADVIYAIVKPAADIRGIDEEAFSDLMTGQTLSAATAALWGGLKEFFEKMGRADVCQMIETQEKFMTAIVDSKADFLATVDLAAVLDATGQDKPALPDAQ